MFIQRRENWDLRTFYLDKIKSLAGLYIHIPFCSQFCIYCDFYSTKQTGRLDGFVEALIREINQKKDFFKNRGLPITTIYIGGGTPSLLSQDQIWAIVNSVLESFEIPSLAAIEEFTIEVNPDDVTPEYLSGLRKTGINRLSMGVQSFSDEDLKWMNRRHSAGEAIDAFKNARSAGFDNISLDLIFGYERLTIEGWKNNLDKILELRPEHISSYQLSIEPGSKLGKCYEKGCYNATSQEMSYNEYKMLQKSLKKAGYIQYEVSNFALEGKRAIHNSAYWNFTPYLGLGPSAHSFDGDFRSWNCSNLNQYILQMATGKGSSRKEKLSPRDKFNETTMLSLRKKEGLDLNFLKENFSADMYDNFYKQLEVIILAGSVIKCKNKIKIPPEKLFISDGIIRELFI